ncbi:hypothetical protein HPB51_020111 [Rhipicephalus microplus]|uniref:Uncharacterized protein n=1 Tax=Rhipicephalus microplus TaxID=6941 RepID=A0A9J6EI62_RHIMP|nr:hypothetical protein HPB51_020111 [Rhipicephalus microplus]
MVCHSSLDAVLLVSIHILKSHHCMSLKGEVCHGGKCSKDGLTVLFCWLESRLRRLHFRWRRKCFPGLDDDDSSSSSDSEEETEEVPSSLPPELAELFQSASEDEDFEGFEE